MTARHTRTALLGTISLTTLLIAATPALAEDDARVTLPSIDIYGLVPLPPAAGSEDPFASTVPPSSGDVGTFLKSVTGISVGRMGGHGMEPAIRGLDQNQISVINDGAFHFGGCPNRMDPPSSSTQLYTYDTVIVTRGYQSVMQGPPAPGGTIEFKREPQTFEPGLHATLRTGGGFESNGYRKDGFADATVGNEWGNVRGFTSATAVENYEDGDGNDVRSAFKQYGGGLSVTRTFDIDSYVSFTGEINNIYDALFAGANMDAPSTENVTLRLQGRTDLAWGALKAVEYNIYGSRADHIMDNYSLRTPGPRRMEAITESTTYGGKVSFDAELKGADIRFGIDHRLIDKDGYRFNRTAGNLQGVIWPDAQISETSVFGEATIPLAETTKLVAGLRYAFVHATPDATGTLMAVPLAFNTPDKMYAAFNGGAVADDTDENNISGLIRLEHELFDGVSVFAGASRAMRTADATERWIAMYSDLGGAPDGDASWVGNPDLDPEAHHQVDVGFSVTKERFDYSFTAYHNSVTDYIQRDSGRLLGKPNATIYRNIDATLMGFETEAKFRITDAWKLTVGAAYVHGENETDNIPLAQISPLTGKVEIAYETLKWFAGARLNAAAEQTRVDDNRATGSGVDAGPTDAWTTVDLFGGFNPTDNFQISAGVTNLFDETYALNQNRQSITDPVGVRVNEPGRSFYVRGTARF